MIVMRLSNKRVFFSLLVLILFLYQAFFYGDYLDSPPTPETKTYELGDGITVSARFARELFRVQEIRCRISKAFMLFSLF